MTVAEIVAEYGRPESTVRRLLMGLKPRTKKITLSQGMGNPYKREVADYLVSDVRKIFGKKKSRTA